MRREAEHDRNRGKTRVLKRGFNMNRGTERERDRKLIWREGRRGKINGRDRESTRFKEGC